MSSKVCLLLYFVETITHGPGVLSAEGKEVTLGLNRFLPLPPERVAMGSDDSLSSFIGFGEIG